MVLINNESKHELLQSTSVPPFSSRGQRSGSAGTVYHFTSKVTTSEPNVKQCAVVSLQRPVKLIISPTFVKGLIAMALLLYNNVLVFSLPAYSCQLFPLCLISGVAGQAGSPETV